MTDLADRIDRLLTDRGELTAGQIAEALDEREGPVSRTLYDQRGRRFRHRAADRFGDDRLWSTRNGHHTAPAPPTVLCARCGTSRPADQFPTGRDECATCIRGRPARHQPTRRKEPPMGTPRVQADETWTDYAARVLGIDREQPCSHCDGTGTTTARITATQVIHTIKNSTAGTTTSDFARWCRNPRLEDLQRVATDLTDQRGDRDLNAAAKFLTRIADLIDQENT